MTFHAEQANGAHALDIGSEVECLWKTGCLIGLACISDPRNQRKTYGIRRELNVFEVKLVSLLIRREVLVECL